jgi:peptidoglycan/LPS O-acetylase OafA/YrhL
MAMFAAGSAFYLLRDRIVFRADITVGLLAIWIAAFDTPLSTAAGMGALPYLVAIFAYRTPRSLRRLTAKGDVSYGVYVYAFPVQQSIVATLGTTSPLIVAGIAAPVVWLLAFASWRLVEQPFLRRRRAGLEPGASASVHAVNPA